MSLEKVSILHQDTIHIARDLWRNHVAADLLAHVKADRAARTKFALVTDTNLHDKYVPDFVKAFAAAQKQLGSNDDLLVYTVPPGESSKSRDTVGALHDWLATNRCTKDAVVIALGGGVIGDMVGYAAATYMRGVAVVQVPTTLLSMVDSSVGGKTAIDTPLGKNLVGAFHQPKRVYIDLKFLETLPKREFINGMAEIIKTAAIWTETEFAFLEAHADLVMQYLDRRTIGDALPLEITTVFQRMVRESVRVKAHVVTEDEKEGGLRNLLNLGHSIGHAMEAVLAPQILHGECVAVGMVREAELSRFLGHLAPSAVARLTACLAAYRLPVSLDDALLRKRSANRKVSVDTILVNMAVDKKNAGGKKRIVLLAAIGRTLEPKATAVEDDAIRLVLSPALTVHRGQPPAAVSCTPPGSKSISNRALVLAALANGTTRIKNLLHSDDTQFMQSALADLRGASFSWQDDGDTLVVEGNGGKLAATPKPLYLGNAGTAARFLTAVASLADGTILLTGNARMKERPIGPLVDSLRANGVDVEFQERDGSLPIKVAAAGLEGGDITLAATVSSQYVSALLMCAPYAKNPVTLKLDGRPVSQPYIDMTISIMAAFGVTVEPAGEHAYRIPTQAYTSPGEYTVESDASSATYPLAIAAITGTSCTIPNIGSASLQGDARFATDVLRPMGCTVEQTATSTTVKGPTRLKAISLDMEPLTDTFLTACVLGAVAAGTTRITGIANQRVKECDRIAAMHDELAKFGVVCRQSDGGIEVDGGSLKAPGPIHCYDDHRVAMSFSVLALVAPEPVVVDDRACTAKTWPAWWDALHRDFGAALAGVELPKAANGIKDARKERSIFLIGMRGAGKTTAGRWGAPVLGWQFTDLDHELEAEGTSIPDLVRQHGWDHFRREETRILEKALREKPFGHVIACGGGIVETESNRRTLKAYHEHGGTVVLVHRDIDLIYTYLSQDKSRPAYVDDIRSVWDRRRQWYAECSNFEYHGSNVDILGDSASVIAELAEREKYAQFLRLITGRLDPLAIIRRRDRSYFVSLTLPRLTASALSSLYAAVVGSDAVELRVDLLEDPDSPGLPSVDFVVRESAILRSSTQLPLIFTIRTKSQGGRFPDDAHDEALALYTAAMRMAFEFIDLEMSFPDAILDAVLSRLGPSRVIASHHDPAGALSWSTGAWMPYYNRALQYGYIVKLVSNAKSMSNNDDLEGFRKWAHATNPNVPLIALNMGSVGKLSRVRNQFLTPVAHPALPFKAAPGQLSAAEIRQALALIGEIDPLRFFIFGDPVGGSRSPALHAHLFAETGLPHTYERFETGDANKLVETIRSPDFGGASVTIPLKVAIMPLLDSIAEEARLVGAVNTIVPSRHGDKIHLTGHNTDWAGIARALRAAGARPGFGSGLVIGSGGTSRAAVYCLHQMGYSPIYLAGRTAPNLRDVAKSFPSTYNVQVITTADFEKLDLASLVTPTAAVGCIPGDRPMDEALGALTAALFDHAPSPDEAESHRTRPVRVLLEMAYKPAHTQLMQLAEKHGWETVPGLEALVAQGVKQFELWTGLDVDGGYAGARDAVLLGDGRPFSHRTRTNTI